MLNIVIIRRDLIQLTACYIVHTFFIGRLSFPTTVDDLRELVSSVYNVKRTDSGLLLVVFSAAYLYKQTFAIPGSALLVCYSLCFETRALCINTSFQW